MNSSEFIVSGVNQNGKDIKPLEICIESLRKLGLSEEELKKLFESIDAIIENRIDALLLPANL